MVFPIRVLVEEGKHASILDRNADGVYTPGYDVNARVNDAWGLRDVLGSSVLMGSGFSPPWRNLARTRFNCCHPTTPRSVGGGVASSQAPSRTSVGTNFVRPHASPPATLQVLGRSFCSQ